jgi:SynChlorMet cassette protein ScmC
MYCINLSDHQNWNLIATQAAESWLTKLAKRLELQKGFTNTYPVLLFTLKNDHEFKIIPDMDRLIGKSLPRTNWNTFNIRSVKIRYHPHVSDVICEINDLQDASSDILKMCLALYPLYQQSQIKGGLPMHAALVEFDGKGYLLAARGETGKTTCCRRLTAPWHALCDDETLIVMNNRKQYQAHPFPTWADLIFHDSQKTWNIQYHLPLAAVFFLKQNKFNRITSIGQGEAAIKIHDSATQIARRYWIDISSEEIRKFQKQLFNNACEIAKSVPSFILNVNKNGLFWQEIEKSMKKLS